MNSTMASNLLPQALCTIPRNPTQCNHKKLRFSASLAIPHRPSPLNSAQLPNSRVFLNDLTLTSLVTKFSSPSFVVRAEPNADVGEPGSSDVIEESEVAVEAAAVETEAEVQAENKPPPKRPRVKLGDIMGILDKKAIEASDQERKTPDIRTGDVVEIKMEVPENRRRLSVYKGIVMSKQNAGIHTTIRVRRIVAGIGVEIVFPVYSPNIKEIKVVSHRKVRRARLYYLREKLPRLSTFK